MDKYTDEELAGLTDAEREALLEEDELDTEAEDGEAEGDEANDKPDTDETDGEDDNGSEGAGDDKADDEQQGDDNGDDDGEGEPAEGDDANADEEDNRVTVPLLNADLPEDVEAKLKDIETAKDELVKKFDDGDLTASEYNKEYDKLAKQEREIEKAVFKSQIAQEMEQQRIAGEWSQTVNNFMREHPEYTKYELRYSALDTAVRKIAGEDSSLSGRQVLEKAHKLIQEQFGIVDTAQGEAEAKPKPKKPVEVPPTLAKVPSAEIDDMSGGKYAELDRLAQTDPLRYERELGRMSDAERERYLEG